MRSKILNGKSYAKIDTAASNGKSKPKIKPSFPMLVEMIIISMIG
jgi:hypothetical protein